MSVQTKTSIYFAIELSLREISFLVYVHALICRALMTPKSCAVGMRNAILRNHINDTRFAEIVVDKITITLQHDPCIFQILILQNININREIIKVRERILHIGLLTKVILLKLFLDISPSSPTDFTRA